MIITGLQAENILKYERLELSELPPTGVVAVSGQNESGKSSIGETICFALFGRTYSCDPQALERIIRWGERSGSARLSFTTSDGAGYEIARFVDRDGNHSARLHRQGSEDEPIARGAAAVNEAVVRLLGYDFEEFIESFYLAQREITAPHSHSHAVQAMAGLTVLEQARGEFEREIRAEQEAIAGLEPRLAELSAEIEALGIDGERLAALEAERTELRERESAAGRFVAELKAASDAYLNNFQKLGTTRRGRNVGVVLCLLLLAGAGVTAGSIWVPAMQALRNDGPIYTWMLAAVVCGVLFFFACLGVAVLHGRLRSFERLSEEFAQKLGVFSRSPEAATDACGDAAAASLRGFAEIQTRIAHSLAEPDEVEAAMQNELAVINCSRHERQRRLESLGREIYAEQERLEKQRQLQQALDAVEARVDEHLRRIAQRELAGELLLGARGHLTQQFNRDLRDLVGRTLPLFTDGRYAHLEIDGNLGVRVFSNEKRDFMGMEEISSGTQRQIMLAVRLALSQKLADSIGAGRQFVFLDEPFAFFDQARTRSALAALPRLSDELIQIWVVAQAFPADVAFARHIECARQLDRLEGAVVPAEFEPCVVPTVAEAPALPA